jgi:hypothetical protein
MSGKDTPLSDMDAHTFSHPEELAKGRFTWAAMRIVFPACKSWRRAMVVEGRWAAVKLVRDKKPRLSSLCTSEATFTVKGGLRAGTQRPLFVPAAALARKERPRRP